MRPLTSPDFIKLKKIIRLFSYSFFFFVVLRTDVLVLEVNLKRMALVNEVYFIFHSVRYHDTKKSTCC